jgi:hypothetical protein
VSGHEFTRAESPQTKWASAPAEWFDCFIRASLTFHESGCPILVAPVFGASRVGVFLSLKTETQNSSQNPVDAAS